MSMIMMRVIEGKSGKFRLFEVVRTALPLAE